MKHILAAALLLGGTALANAQGFPNLAYGTPAGCLYQPAGQTIAAGSFGYVQCGAAGGAIVMPQDGTAPPGFPSTLSATGTFGSGLNGWIDTTGYQSIATQLTGTFVGTVTFEVTNDNTQASGTLQMGTTTANGGTGADTTVDTAPAMHIFPVTARYFRARVSAYTSGSLTETIFLRSAPYNGRSIAVANSTALLVGEAGSATSTFGAAPAVAGSAQSGVIIKASTGNLYSVYATSTAAAWLMVFNSATVPSNGATTAGIAASNLMECVPLAAQGATNFYAAINYAPGPGELFTTGISAALSSTACATLTLATTGFIHGLAR